MKIQKIHPMVYVEVRLGGEVFPLCFSLGNQSLQPGRIAELHRFPRCFACAA